MLYILEFTMKVRVTEIGANGLIIDQSLERKLLNQRLSLAGHTDLEFVEDLQAKLTVFRTGQGANVKGLIKTQYAQNCSRCLVPAITQVNLKIDSIFHEKHSDRNQLKEDIGITFYDNGEIDLGEHLQEQALLQTNPFSYCSQDCKGLCVHCGCNLNTDKCDCACKIDPPKNDLFNLKIN